MGRLAPFALYNDALELRLRYAIGSWPRANAAVSERGGQISFDAKSSNPQFFVIGQSHSREQHQIGDENPLSDIRNGLLAEIEQTFAEINRLSRFNHEPGKVELNGRKCDSIQFDVTLGDIGRPGMPQSMLVKRRTANGDVLKIEGEQRSIDQSETSAVFTKICGSLFVLDSRRVMSLVLQSPRIALPKYLVGSALTLPDDDQFADASNGLTRNLARALTDISVRARDG